MTLIDPLNQCIVNFLCCDHILEKKQLEEGGVCLAHGVGCSPSLRGRHGYRTSS